MRVHLDLMPRRSLGMHFGTFQLTDGAIDAPVLALRQARSQANVTEREFDVLHFGETREYAMADGPCRGSESFEVDG
jgi:hypothetical protein